MSRLRFARWIFLLAGVIGLVIVVPPFFQEDQFGREYPPEITHPEFFYGFLTAVLAWQLMYITIGTDPVRFRRAMLPAILAKASYVFAVLLLYTAKRVYPVLLGFAAMDATFAVLFVVAYVATRKAGGGSV
jgi:hypothetical protein